MILRTAAASSRKAVACCMFPKAALGRQGYTKVQVSKWQTTATRMTRRDRQRDCNMSHEILNATPDSAGST
jgi:hypothetical protein